MKNFTSNKSLRQVRSLITGILMALLFGSLVGGESPVLGAFAVMASLVSGIALAYGYTKSERRGMAFMACGLVSANIEIDCDALTGGVSPTFYIANKDDISAIPLNVTNSMIAESITMLSTKLFYTIEGQLQSLEPKMTMIPGKYINQYEHEIGFLIFKIDPTTRQQVLAMKDGNFVIIVKNNQVGATGNTKWEIYGGDSGLKCTVTERNAQDAETLGAFKVTLKTAEYAREGKPPMNLFITSAAATQSVIDALLIAAP